MKLKSISCLGLCFLSLLGFTKVNASANPDIVIGQLNMTSTEGNRGGTVGANTLSSPNSVFSDGSKLIIADRLNQRVLLFNSIPASNNANADIVIGKSDMNGNDSGYNLAKSVGMPTAVCYANNKLFIADESDERVLIYNQLPSSNEPSADVVVGQSDFVLLNQYQYNPSTPTSKKLKDPQGVFSDGTKLFIADTGHHRVLIYNQIPTSNGATPDIVIGQSDVNSVSENRGGTEATANTLASPSSVYYDGTKLIIADTGNHRVLIYNQIPTSNGSNADLVIGQENMSGKSANQGGVATAKSLNSPVHVMGNDGKIYITDKSNHRILIFYQIPTSNNQSADFAVGDGGLQSSSSSRNSNGFFFPSSSHIVGSKFFVTDGLNNRALIFNRIPAKAVSSTETLPFTSKKVKRKVSFRIENNDQGISSIKKNWISLRLNNRKIKVSRVKISPSKSYFTVWAQVNNKNWTRGDYNLALSYKYKKNKKKTLYRKALNEPSILSIQ